MREREGERGRLRETEREQDRVGCPVFSFRIRRSMDLTSLTLTLSSRRDKAHFPLKNDLLNSV